MPTLLAAAVLFALFVLLALFGLGCKDGDSSPESASTLSDKPNVLLLIGDDHGYPYFGFTGSEIVQTPQLDRLAEHGTVFTRGYSTSNTCRPALWTLLTGLYPYQMYAQVAERTGAFTPGRAGVEQWRDADLAFVEAIRNDPDTLPRAFAREG
jgi:hypothetical protein